MLASAAPAADFPREEYERHVIRYLEGVVGLSVRVTDTDYTQDGTATIRTDVTIETIKDYVRAKRVRRITYTDGSEASGILHTLVRPDGCYHIREKSPGRFVLESHDKSATSLLLVGQHF